MAAVEETRRRGSPVAAMAARLGLAAGRAARIRRNQALQRVLQFVRGLPEGGHPVHPSAGRYARESPRTDAQANVAPVRADHHLLLDHPVQRADVDSAVYGADIRGVRCARRSELDDGDRRADGSAGEHCVHERGQGDWQAEAVLLLVDRCGVELLFVVLLCVSHAARRMEFVR